jgi:hypothetical protein
MSIYSSKQVSNVIVLTPVFQHPVSLSLVKLILHTVRHNATFVVFPSFSLHVSATIGHLQVFGSESFHAALIGILCCI